MLDFRVASRVVGVLLLALLCFGFEWPGRVARLTQQLHSEDVVERREAARMLGEHSAENARAALLLALDDDDAAVRQAAVASAAKIGMREQIPVLIDWLNAPAVDTRVAAAAALGVLREPRAEAPLIRALGDADARVRAAATVALGRAGSVESVTPLLGRLDDPDPGVRLEAVKTLGLRQDARTLMPLIGRTQDSALEVRVMALSVLGDLGDVRALPALVRSLDDDSDLGRLAAVAALGALGQPAAMEPLRARLLGADSRVGRAVLAALSAIGTEPAVRLIAEQLGKPELSRGAVDVLVERVRRVRQLDPPAAKRVVAMLTAALSQDTDSARATAIEDALIGCSRHVSIQEALPALLEAFAAQRGTLPMISLALAATADDSALLALLERLDAAQPDEQLPLLRALDVLMLATPPDGRAADPLLATLTRAQPDAIALVARLLGRSHAQRALPALIELLGNARQEVRLSAIDAIGMIGAAESTDTLLPLLEERVESVRTAATLALGRTLNVPDAVKLLGDLEGHTDVRRYAALSAVEAALARLSDAGPMGDAYVAALLPLLVPLIDHEDESVAALAVDALSALKTMDAANAIATLLRKPQVARRAHAARALGNFDDARVRHVLRFVMTHDHIDVAVAAASALGRTGETEDAQSLAKLAARFHWPFPAAASYGISLIARRGLLKPIASHAMLCELGRSREPIVRANVAIAMAQLGAVACDNGVDPLQWLQPEHAPQVRAAAARWIFAAMNDGHLDRERAMKALTACAARDSEPRVADACAGPVLPPLDTTVRQVIHDSEGRATLSKRLLAFELADGRVFVGHTNANGRLDVAPAPTDRVVVSDPGLLPLEPPSNAARTTAASPHPAAPPDSQP